MTGNFGYDAKATFDVGGGYKFPLTAIDQFLSQGLDFQAIIGGTSWVTVSVGFFRINFYLTLDVAQATMSNSILFDVVSYSQICLESSFFRDYARIVLEARIDILECDQGLLDIIFFGKDSAFCEWNDNFIDYPLFDGYLPAIYSPHTKNLLPRKCLKA